jgi:DNA-binding CsgD family transcriptional regulator
MMVSGKPISKECIQQIREEILKGKSKFQVSKEMHLHPMTVYAHTKDLPNEIGASSL